jgi:hypothetical protein
MKPIDIRFVIRKFISLLPRVLVVTVTILWVYHSAVYFKNWGTLILSGVKLIDKTPMGGDFSHYWSAARLALYGDPAATYDPERLQASMKAFFGVPILLAWYYPPTFLLILLPLAWLPYSAALATWLLFTLGAYLYIITRIAPYPLTIFLALIFSATIQNFAYGQNGLLSAALLGGGLLLVDESPITGGCLLGLLTYKPHLAVLVLIALLGGRHWKALSVMLVSALGFILASVAVFGYRVWDIFLIQHIPQIWKTFQAGEIIHGGSFPWGKMPTFFSALHAAGIGLLPSVLVQGFIMLALSVLVFRVWRQDYAMSIRGSVLVLGTLLFTPYLFIYDLCLLSLPLAWLVWEGYKMGWMPGERYFLFFCWVMPMFSEEIVQKSYIPIAPITIILLLFLIWIRNNSDVQGEIEKM